MGEDGGEGVVEVGLFLVSHISVFLECTTVGVPPLVVLCPQCSDTISLPLGTGSTLILVVAVRLPKSEIKLAFILMICTCLQQLMSYVKGRKVGNNIYKSVVMTDVATCNSCCKIIQLNSFEQFGAYCNGHLCFAFTVYK